MTGLGRNPKPPRQEAPAPPPIPHDLSNQPGALKQPQAGIAGYGHRKNPGGEKKRPFRPGFLSPILSRGFSGLFESRQSSGLKVCRSAVSGPYLTLSQASPRQTIFVSQMHPEAQFHP